MSVKKNTDGFTDEKYAQKKIPAGNIPLVIVAYEVNIFQLSVKCQRTVFVCIGVGNYGVCSKYFSTLGKIPTKCFRL